MSAAVSIDAACRDLCAALADISGQVSWPVRLAAAAMALESVTGIKPVVVTVRAAAYSRSAVLRLGGAMIPQHQGEVEHFREQVGPAMILLGLEGAAPHAVLAVGTHLVEVAHGVDWNDRGVLVRPFAHAPGARGSRWSVGGLRFGVTVAYEQVPRSSVQLSDGAAVLAFADELRVATKRKARRAVGA